MSNPVVILLHGMGNHTVPKPSTNERGSFGKECIDTLNRTLQLYPTHKDMSIEDEVSFVEINFNHIFDSIRKDMADAGKSVKDFIAGAGAGTQLGDVPGLIASIANFEASLNDDDFIFTHWLDVMFYKSYWGEMVRNHVASKLGEVMSKNGARDLHIVAHSLGTAVIHDVLHKSYSGQYLDNDDIADLSIGTHKFASLTMIANVSRLANTISPIANPYQSVVKPGPKGVARRMMNIHHQLDPFTWPKNFVRQKNHNWVSEATFDNSYVDIKTTAITEKNPHSITQYLFNPAVHLLLFRLLGIKRPTQKSIETAQVAYKSETLDGVSKELTKALAEIKKGNAGDLKDFFDAAKKLKEFIKN